MFEKVLTFIAGEEYLEKNEFLPEPIKLNIPDWFKKLKHLPEFKTVKGCMPFLDTLTTGYLLKTPLDFRLLHNATKEGERVSDFYTTLQKSNLDSFNFYNLNASPQYHPYQQLGKECPYVNKNKDLPIHKILNPWIIKTPPGYSCLFVPPLNNSDDRFSIIPGIVDTDTFPSQVNFPFVVNGDKYPVLDTIIKIGTPYVQVIPFKRDNWKMKIEGISQKNYLKERFFQELKIINNYKENWWNKKTWK